MGNVIKRVGVASHHNSHPDNIIKLNPRGNIQLKGVTISENPDKKYKAEFIKNGTTVEIIHFGDAEIADFTKHVDFELKQNYIVKNHNKCGEKWCEPMNDESLSRWILWNRPTLNGGIKDYKERFALA